jgi:hypothetical protein
MDRVSACNREALLLASWTMASRVDPHLDRSLTAAEVDVDDKGRAWRSCDFKLERSAEREEEPP